MMISVLEVAKKQTQGYLFVRKVNLKGIKTALIISSNTGVVVMAVCLFSKHYK